MDYYFTSRNRALTSFLMDENTSSLDPSVSQSVPPDFLLTTEQERLMRVYNNISDYNLYNITSGNITFLPFDPAQVKYPSNFHKPAWEYFVKIFSYVLIIMLALIGNCLVIIIVWRNKRMRTTTNYYIVNLAVSDLLVTCSCTWVHLVDDITEGWVLGAFFCRFNSFAQVLGLVSSIMTLTLIACDRFFGIVFAMKAHVTERRAKLFLVAVWVCAVMVSAPLLFYRKEFRRQWLDHTEIWCSDTWPLVREVNPDTQQIAFKYPLRTVYFTCISLVLYFFPVLVMSVAYVFIMVKLWASRSPGEQIEAGVVAKNRVKKRVIIMLVFILLVFTLCWLPLQIAILYDEHRPDIYKPLPSWYTKFNFFANFLAFSNSALNPIIYTGFNENFKRGFKALFKVCRKRRKQHMYSSIGVNHSQTQMENPNTFTTQYYNNKFEKGDGISLSNTIVTRIS